MANKKIEQLTDDTAVNMNVNDLLPFAKYVSPGVYNTVFKKGSNIINTITGLPTANFTNINTSINNVSNSIIPTINNNLGILTVYTGVNINVPAGGTTTVNIGTGVFNSLMSIKRPYIVNVKLYAYCNGSTLAVNTQEYNIGFANNILIDGFDYPNKLYEYSTGANIFLNASGFTFSSNTLKFSISHAITGETVSVYARAIIYSH